MMGLLAALVRQVLLGQKAAQGLLELMEQLGLLELLEMMVQLERLVRLENREQQEYKGIVALQAQQE
jgi:hypothetical protein